MFKALRWLFGLEDKVTIQQVKLIYLAEYGKLLIPDSQYLQQVNDVCRPLGYNVTQDNFWIIPYRDMQDSFVFKDHVPSLEEKIAEYAEYAGNHAIIMHEGTCSYLWDFGTQLGQKLIGSHGFQSYCFIGYTSHHKEGCSYVVGKTNIGYIDNDFNMMTPSENFISVRRQMFEGLKNDSCMNH